MSAKRHATGSVQQQRQLPRKLLRREPHHPPTVCQPVPGVLAGLSILMLLQRRRRHLVQLYPRGPLRRRDSRILPLLLRSVTQAASTCHYWNGNAATQSGISCSHGHTASSRSAAANSSAQRASSSSHRKATYRECMACRAVKPAGTCLSPFMLTRLCNRSACTS